MGQEKATNAPKKDNEQVLYPLENILKASNRASVVLFDANNHSYGRDKHLEMRDMIYIYAPMFGHKGEIRDTTKDTSSLGDDLEKREYGEIGDYWRMEYIRKDEAQRMAEILFMPLTNHEQIKKRQQLLEQLSSSDQLDKLISTKNKAYNLIAGVQDLCAYVGPHFSEEALINLYYKGVTAISTAEYAFEEQDGEEEVLPMVVEGVDKISEGLSAMNSLQELATSPFFKQTLFNPLFIPDVEEKLKKIIPFDKTEPKEQDEIYEPDDYLRGILEKKIEPYLLRIGATLEFAKK
jgi:hypothetical protein